MSYESNFDPELFDPIEEFNLADDPAYLEYSAKVNAEADQKAGVSMTEGLKRLGDVSDFERQAYVATYHAAGLRSLAFDAGIPWYDIHGGAL